MDVKQSSGWRSSWRWFGRIWKKNETQVMIFLPHYMWVITNRYQLSKHAIFLKIDWNVTDIVTVIFLRSICRHFFYALLFQVFCSFIYLVAARIRFHWDEATKCHILARQECSMFSNTNAKCHLSLVLVISLVRKKAVVYVIGYIMKQDARYARGFPPSID